MTGPAFSARAAADYIRAQAIDHAEILYGVRPGDRVDCPLHAGSDSGSFEVYADSGRWGCHARKAYGDVVDFWAQRYHGLDHDQRVTGALFRICLRELLERLGASPDRFPQLGPEETERNGKPYPPADEVEAVLGEAVLPLYALRPREDGSKVRLMLNGRERPGIGSYAQLHGLDMDGPGLVRMLRASKNTAHRPEWAQRWRFEGVVLPTYNGAGELVSLRYRTLGESKAYGKGRNPGVKGQFAAGALLLNRPARELLHGDAHAKVLAREHGVIVTEGDPAFLAWSTSHPGPVIGLPGSSAVAGAFARIPRDAPVLLDFDPDAAGAKYLGKALAALAQHLDVRWSARMRWYFETEPAVRAETIAERRPKTKADREAAEKAVSKRINELRLEAAKGTG